LWSSWPCLLRSWDYRPAPPHLACWAFYITYQPPPKNEVIGSLLHSCNLNERLLIRTSYISITEGKAKAGHGSEQP
jgi:hypothetical protein